MVEHNIFIMSGSINRLNNYSSLSQESACRREPAEEASGNVLISGAPPAP
jgi:hypothetical protein